MFLIFEYHTVSLRINQFASNIKTKTKTIKLYNFKNKNTANKNMLMDFKAKLDEFKSDKQYLQNISAQLQLVELFMSTCCCPPICIVGNSVGLSYSQRSSNGGTGAGVSRWRLLDIGRYGWGTQTRA